ncbi:MAG: DUF2200 domain-containing protein [Candidatus Cryptobacteroides sp.]
MSNKVFALPFAKVFPLLIAKAERKGRTREEVLLVTGWMTGYSPEQLEELLLSDATYGEFLSGAPSMNPARLGVKGKVCGVQIETIEDPMMRDLRILDKLVDELAKGWPIEKITGKR